MNCFTCEKNLSAYIDDELPQDQRVEIEGHLGDCDACREEYEGQLTIWESVAEAGSATAPDNLWRGIESELEQTGHTGTTMDDLALIVRGLADEVRQLRHEVQSLQRNVEDQAGSNRIHESGVYETDPPFEERERRVRSTPGLSIWTEPGTGRRLSDVG